MEQRPLETEFAYAPNSIEGINNLLGSMACEGECHLQVCMQDRHHVIYGTDLTEAERLLKSHPDFIYNSVCRAKHETVHKMWRRSEPLSDEFAVGYLTASPVNLTANKKRRLKELRKGIGR